MSHEETIPTFVIQFILVIALVPVVAIVASITAGVIKMTFGYKERRAKLRDEASARVNNALCDEVEALRRELAQLRDTATQYDVSIQHTLEELNQRMARVESIVRPPGVASINGPAEEQPAVMLHNRPS